jgi:hypothetical protein
MRRLFVLAIALIVLSGCGSDSAVSQTNIKTFVPWKSDGSGTTVTVKNRSTGSCFGASAKVDAAYRCFVGAEIQDPCFAPPNVPNPTTVACAADPWSELLVVTISGGLPETMPISTTNPHWAIRLENHDQCVSLGAAVSPTDGVSMPYACTSRSTASNFDKEVQPWTVRYNKNNMSFDLTPLHVIEAW